MDTTNPGHTQFPTVYRFCSQDMETYLDVLDEIRTSVKNLVSLLDNQDYSDIDKLKFLRHKMKSTFRILEDDNFRQVLDDFTQSVEDADKGWIEKNLKTLYSLCESYEGSLTRELEKHSS